MPGRFRITVPLVALLFGGFALLALALGGCTPRTATKPAPEPAPEPAPARASVATTATVSGGRHVKTIYIAGGCFWGLEKYIAQVNGVLGTEVGYANGTRDNAKYGDDSGYAEAVKVDYDPAVAPLPFLLDLFYDAVDPTSRNRQGNDVGVEYRTGVYYTDPADKAVIDQSLAQLQTQLAQPIAIESGPLIRYSSAEEYHQDYLNKNPGGYCHIPQKLFDAAKQARPK